MENSRFGSISWHCHISIHSAVTSIIVVICIAKIFTASTYHTIIDCSWLSFASYQFILGGQKADFPTKSFQNVWSRILNIRDVPHFHSPSICESENEWQKPLKWVAFFQKMSGKSAEFVNEWQTDLGKNESRYPIYVAVGRYEEVMTTVFSILVNLWT